MVSARGMHIGSTFRRRVGAALCAAATLLVGSAWAAGAQDKVAELRRRLARPTPGDTLVIAHRGCWQETAENSIASVQACIHEGVDGVEFDVRHSKDGIAVVIHDETVDRTTDGHGKVADLTLAQLKALRLKPADGRAGGEPTAYTIPMLDEFLVAAKGRLLLVFDVKDLTQRESFKIAKRIGVAGQAIFFYECSNDLLLTQIRPFWNETFVFPITFGDGPPLPQSMAACPSNPKGMVHAKFDAEDTLTAPAVRAALERKRVWVATMRPQDVAGHGDAPALLDPGAHWGWLLRAGANMIMTNEPQALRAYLAQHPRGE